MLSWSAQSSARELYRAIIVSALVVQVLRILEQCEQRSAKNQIVEMHLSRNCPLGVGNIGPSFATASAFAIGGSIAARTSRTKAAWLQTTISPILKGRLRQ